MASAAPKTLNTALNERDRKFRSKEFFIDRPYKSGNESSKDWNDAFKQYVNSLENNQKKLDYLRYVERYFDSLDGFELEKKRTRLKNRLKEIKQKAYASFHGSQLKIEKVGCVLIDSDRNVIVNKTEKKEDGKLTKIQYGFPKGDIEYGIGTKLDTISRETPIAGALRELQEETGIVKHGELPKNGSGAGVYFQQDFELDGKHVKSDKMELKAWRELYNGEDYYLILSVSHPVGLKLEPYLTASNKKEYITGLEWKHQYVEGGPFDFNSYSKKPMVYNEGPSPLGGAALPPRPAGGAGGSASSNWRTGKRWGGRKTRKLRRA